MQHQITEDGRRVIVHLRGSLYVQDAAQLREELTEYIRKGFNLFVIEMKGVDYIDSSGLGVLVAINTRVVETAGRVVLKGLAGKVLEVFTRTRLIKVFETED
ncbi:MAG: STAS domain-containing protein [Negativicutes bacterium]|nr:STAS domain-containing protein [Negativicutes bacterium]